MQCVILAGGIGSRMRPVTEAVPKAMICVRGKPFADYQLAWLADQGVKEVVYSIGYKGQMIRDHVGDGSAWGLRVTYVDEGPELRGTAGALRLACDAGALDERFFVLYGDSFLPIALRPVEEAFVRSGRPALMTVFRNQGRWDVSNVVYGGGLVVLYDKGRADPRSGHMEYVDYGLSALRREVIEGRVPSGRSADLAEVFRQLSLAGALAGFEATQRFFEIGSPAGLRDFEAYLAGDRGGP